MSDETVMATDPTNDVDTQETTTQAPPADDSGHGVEGDISSSNQQVTVPAKEPDTEALKREYGKLKQTQEEAKKLQSQLDEYQKIITSSPEVFEKALIQTANGQYTEAQAKAYVEDLKAKGYWKTESSPQAPLIDPRQIAEQVKREVVSEQYFKTEIEKFIAEVPEMNPANVPADKVEETKALAERVDYIAQAYAQANPNVSFKDALLKAYKLETNKTDAEIEQAREAGKIEGMAMANAVNGSISKAPVASQSTKSTVRLSPEDQEAAKLIGMTPEDYLKYSGDVTVK